MKGMNQGVDERTINPIDFTSSSLASRVVDGKHDRPNAGADKEQSLSKPFDNRFGPGLSDKGRDISSWER